MLGAEEVPAVADLDVGVEREAGLVDLERRELALEQVEELAVGGELLERRDEPALEPAGRLPAHVRAAEERGDQRVEGLVARPGSRPTWLAVSVPPPERHGRPSRRAICPDA